MRKINRKNKMLFFIFAFTIVLVILLLVYGVFMVINSSTEKDSVSSNTILFDKNTQFIDTSMGGFVSKKWSGEYIYDSSKNEVSLGANPVIYEKVSGNITLLDNLYFISASGETKKYQNFKLNTKTDDLGIYKLADRKYLIIAHDITSEDKSISLKNYVIVFLDKRGNASLLNDTINVKTINPLKLIYNDIEFDVANETLTYDDKKVDLKLINGSSNEYVPFNAKEKNINMVNFVNSYNKLVNDFNKYTSNNNLNVASNTFVSNSTNNVVINSSGNSNISNGNTGSNSNNTNDKNNNTSIPTNKVPLNKMVSLRGAVASANYIDVSYVVTDPEDAYEAVYLLVVGKINGEDVTQKIILNKYNTAERVANLSLASEYTISLGYIENKSFKGEISLIDEIEDVINIRTKKSGATISVDKISAGYVNFTFKMNPMYAYDEGNIALYSGDEYLSSVPFDYNQAISSIGFKGKLKLNDGKIFTLKLEDHKYNSIESNDVIKKKFSY